MVQPRAPASGGKRWCASGLKSTIHATPFLLAAAAACPGEPRAGRRLARDPPPAALSLGVQGPRDRGAAGADRRQGRQRRRAGAVEAHCRQPRPEDGDAGRAARAAGGVRRAAAVDHGLHRAARIPVRQGDAALGAHDRARGLPPSARAVAALSPRAPDRRAHPRRRARHARHLDADQFHAVLDPADVGRDRPCLDDPDRALRLDVHRDHRLRARALYRLPPC